MFYRSKTGNVKYNVNVTVIDMQCMTTLFLKAAFEARIFPHRKEKIRKTIDVCKAFELFAWWNYINIRYPSALISITSMYLIN